MDFGTPTALALLRRTVTGRDSDGNDILGVTADLAYGAFDPGGSTEATQGQDQVTTQPTVYLTAGSLAPVDAVVVGPTVEGGTLILDSNSMPVGGTTYEVDGTPAVYVSPFTGWSPGVVVRLLAVSG